MGHDTEHDLFMSDDCIMAAGAEFIRPCIDSNFGQCINLSSLCTSNQIFCADPLMFRVIRLVIYCNDEWLIAFANSHV